MTTEIAIQSQQGSLPQLPAQGLRLIDVLCTSAHVMSIAKAELVLVSPEHIGPLSELISALEARGRPASKADIIIPLTRLANHWKSDRTPAEWRMLFEDYVLDLQDFSAGDVEDAIHEHRRTEKFFPRISELIAKCTQYRGQREWQLIRAKELRAHAERGAK